MKETIEEKITRELEENNQRRMGFDAIKRLANVNRFEDKALTTFAMSLLPYGALIGLSLHLFKDGNAISTISVEGLSVMITGGSLLVGAVGTKLLNKKKKIKERLQPFTDAKTEAEKLEVEVKSEVEVEKAENRNLILQKAVDFIVSEQKARKDLAKQYDMRDKNLDKSPEEIQTEVESLSRTLEEKYGELDLLIFQKVLNDYFWGVREKANLFLNTSVVSILGGAFTMCCMNVPTLIFRDYLPDDFSLVHAITPAIVGAIGSGCYMLKKNQVYSKAFQSLNKQLGENALPNKTKSIYNDQEEIRSKIELAIDDLGKLKAQLLVQKQYLEMIQDFSRSIEKEPIKDPEKVKSLSEKKEY